LTIPQIFKTRSYFEIPKHFSAEYCGGNDLSWTWRQSFISHSSAGWMTPIFLQLNWCKFQQGICSLIQSETENTACSCQWNSCQWNFYQV
jgi:hypothetical protein